MLVVTIAQLHKDRLTAVMKFAYFKYKTIS